MSLPRQWLRCSTMACIAALMTAQSATAAELTEPERLHSQLAQTEERGQKLLAARWQALIRQRQWADSTGKHKVYARYVNHDAELKSVTLLVLVKAGEQSSYREKTVPLLRLGKDEQALVKRIAMVRKEVEAAVAAAPAGEASLPGDSRADSPVIGEGREGELGPPTEERPTEQPESPGPPTFLTPEQPVPARPAAAGGKRDRNTPNLPDNAPWRTDFASFAAQLSAQQGSDGKWVNSWGELKQFEPVAQIWQMFTDAKQGRRQHGSPGLFQSAVAATLALQGLGEVTWETTLAEPITANAPLSHDLQLPTPLSLVLIPEERDAGEITRFNAGDRVRFIGRFADLSGVGETPSLTLRVRFPDDQPSPASAESREGYSGEESRPTGGIYRPGT